MSIIISDNYISVYWRQRAIAPQRNLSLRYEFSQSNDIIFNPIKSQCMVFKPNRFKLYCPAVYLDENIINYVKKNIYI